MPTNTPKLEKRLWDAADQLRANSKLKSAEYSIPALGLIFLRYAAHRFEVVEEELKAKPASRRRAAAWGPDDYKARGALYLPPEARYAYLLELPKKTDVGKAINTAMKAIEEQNPELKGILPRNYNAFEPEILATLLKNFNIPREEIRGDLFGRIYEYFLGKFALKEGQKGGEFFTPTSLVKLIVEVIEPYRGRLLDPACGAGGMFVQSAKFVARRRKNPVSEIAIYGQERVSETVRLCKMNLAVHGLSGDIKESNAYYENVHNSTGRFDFVMANPPFNVDKVNVEQLKSQTARFPFGMPAKDNANYVWIQLFYSALNPTGRAGFVMANSAGDAEPEIRRQLVQTGAVDVIIGVASNFFYNVTLSCTLWFFDKSKTGTPRADQILFIDARDLYQQVDRAHREFNDGDVRKEDAQAHFPCLETVPGLLVQSEVDEEWWCWDNGVKDAVQFQARVQGAADALRARAEAIVAPQYIAAAHIPTADFLKAEFPVMASILALAVARYTSAVTTSSNEEARKTARKLAAKLSKQLGALEKDEAADLAAWQNEQAEALNGKTQAVLLGQLAQARVLLDMNRMALPLDDADPAASLREVYAADLEAAAAWWQVTRETHHLETLRDIVRAYRGEEGAPPYIDVPGLCKTTTRAEIEAQGWSLNPGRYVGVTAKPRSASDGADFQEEFKTLTAELQVLNATAYNLGERITRNAAELLGTP